MATSGVLVSVATIAAIWALFALGLNVKFGYTGLLDFGHVAFFLVGAYTTALLVMPPAETQQFQEYVLGWNLPARTVEATGLELMGGVAWLVALLVATIVAGIFGLLVALPAIRLREDYLAIALLGISVIAKRTVQTETWLANGPDSLRGYPLPLQGLFPLPGDSIETHVLFGLVVAVFWTIAVYLLARDPLLDRRSDATELALHVLFGALTLGFGYLVAKYARRRSVAVGPAVVAALVAGGLAAITVAAGIDRAAMVAFVGLPSLFAWAYGALVVVRRFDTVTRFEVFLALGIVVGLFVAFTPALAAGALDGEAAERIGVAATMVLLVAYVWAVYRYLRGWPRRDTDTSALRLLGIAGLWLFLVRYFLVPVGRSLGDPVGAVGTLLLNLSFLVGYAGGDLLFGYSRFLLAVAVGALALSYRLAEITVRSPFGRVLKSIREDEDVAMALGKNTFSYKVQSMILGSAMAGLAGGLMAIYYGTLTFRSFDPLYTFFMFLIVVIGGTANNRGVILGAALYWAFVQGTNDVAAALPTSSAAISALRIALLGALFVAILYYRPQGIWGERRLVHETEER